ncbi:MAG: prenyltransferase [Gammaproteobacteria bacterium]|nr:prenyltransferase [Gammaproteobacteria bacterium]
MNKFLGVIRAPFLLLTPACISLGAATAHSTNEPVMWSHFVIALIAGLTAHMCVNALNEYLDFRSGLDLKTTKTDFSGGSGTLVRYPEYAPATLLIGVASMIVTVFCGLFLLLTSGPGLLPLGLLGVLIAATYTPWLNRNALLCLIAPGIAFGPIMVIGTHYALTATFSTMAIWVSLVPFFLVSNLLLLNQFPDVEADRNVGRLHLPIRVGRRTSSFVFGAFLLLAYAAILLAVLLKAFPLWALLGTATLPIALVVYIRVRNNSEVVEQLVPAMGLNVLLVLTTPLFLGAGIWLGS